MGNIVFDRPLLYSPEKSGDLWELAADWSLVYEGEVYRLPAGFKTDGASIPRFLWRLCGTPLEVPRLYAALVHDYLYSGGDPEATREDADKLFRDIQIALDVPKFKAWTEYYALRAFGGGHWYANAKGSDKQADEQLTIAEKVAAGCVLLWLMIGALVAGALCGCATKTRNVEIDGMFVQAESATVAIGSVDVMAAPVGEESAIIKYGEDTAWLSPSTKTHSIRIQLTGTNCTQSVTGIVESICRAFIPTAAIINGVGTNAAPKSAAASIVSGAVGN